MQGFMFRQAYSVAGYGGLFPRYSYFNCKCMYSSGTPGQLLQLISLDNIMTVAMYMR